MVPSYETLNLLVGGGGDGRHGVATTTTTTTVINTVSLTIKLLVHGLFLINQPYAIVYFSFLLFSIQFPNTDFFEP
jgi:hypothetical protein